MDWFIQSVENSHPSPFSVRKKKQEDNRMGVRAWKAGKSPAWPFAESSPILQLTLEQFYYDQGEKRLMLAILTDAVGCIERYRTARGARCWTEYHAALQWVRSHDQRWPFSFENICQTLDNRHYAK